MNPHLPQIPEFSVDTSYHPAAAFYHHPAAGLPTSSAAVAHPDPSRELPDEFDDDAKMNSLFERPMKKPKLVDEKVLPVMAVPSRPIVAASASSLMTHHSQIGFSAPVLTSDGYKFGLNSEVEYFIPDEDLYWSFGWLRVRIVSRGKKQVGSKSLSHYLVEHIDGDEHSQSTVEEWQLRPVNPASTGMLGKKLHRHSRVEVHTKFDDPSRPETWFCAEVSEDSSAHEDTVRVRFRNNKWNSGAASNEVHKQRVRAVPPDDLQPQNGVSAKIWAIGEARLPIRLIADEEHKVAEILDRYEEVKAQWLNRSRVSPVEFEPERDVLNELIDSLNNARHYQKSAEIIDFLLTMQRRFE